MAWKDPSHTSSRQGTVGAGIFRQTKWNSAFKSCNSLKNSCNFFSSVTGKWTDAALALFQEL